jgi:hypothetical protein
MSNLRNAINFFDYCLIHNIGMSFHDTPELP